MVFEPPNSTLRKVLGLDNNSVVIESIGDSVELELNASARKYVLIPIQKDKRHFFPGFKVDFELITDAGSFRSHVTGSPGGAAPGDPEAGVQIRGGLGQWYLKHPELKAGDKVRFDALERGKRYKLMVNSSLTKEP